MMYNFKLILLVLFSLTACLSTPSPTPPLTELSVGMPAPDFKLNAVRGGSHSLRDYRGQTVLLSFINTQPADPTLSTPDPSRSQIVFLKSMQTQYHDQGVQFLIIDGSRVESGVSPPTDELLNFTYDWQLDDIPFLSDDESGATARRYGVKQAPTTFLISADGLVTQRWAGFAAAPQLAFALQAALDISVFGTPLAQDETCMVTPPQTQFSGMGLARPLSEQIWVVDGGEAWANNIPVSWLVIRDEAHREPLHLRVTAQQSNSEEAIILVDEILTPLPPDEAAGLLAYPDPLPAVALLVKPMPLEGQGCFQLKAVVSTADQSTILTTGEAVISTR